MPRKLLLSIFVSCVGVFLLSTIAFGIQPAHPKSTDKSEEYLPKPDEFIPVEKHPEMIYEQVPIYPDKARKNDIEGIVWIKSLINKQGEVVKAMILKSSGTNYGLDEAALEAAYKCRFKPAIQDEKPVAVWVSYKVQFALSDDNAGKKDIE